MFTGIIRAIGKVKKIQKGSPWHATIDAAPLAGQLNRGDSVAVSGVCVTVTAHDDEGFSFELSQETIKRSIFRLLKNRDFVNLEPAMTLQTALDGHIVQGHVDGTGKITSITGSKEKRIMIRPDTNPGPLIVDKGSIAVDGVSLTVVDPRRSGEFSVWVIPLTFSETTLGMKRVGDSVNIEYDILGKYVARLHKF